MCSKKAFTLIEIVIASVLVGLIILTITSVDITSRRFFAASSRQVRVQDEARIAMEHIVRNFTRAHQIHDFGTLDADPYTIAVRIDSNTTPSNSADDTWMVYRFVSTVGFRGEIWYYPDAASPPGSPPASPPAGGWASWLNTPYEVIAIDLLIDPAVGMFTVNNNRIEANITAQDQETNTEITLQTSVTARSMPAI